MIRQALLVTTTLGAWVSADDAWRAQIEPYLLLPSIVGETALGRAGSQEIDVDTETILEHLDAAVAIRGELGWKNWSVLGDVAYFSLESEGDRVDAVLNQLIGEIDVGYRFTFVRSWLEVLAGARAWDLEVELDFAGQVPDVTQSQDWVDPIIGVRGELALALGFYLFGRADVGGFGVGADSTWQLEAGGGWSPLPFFAINGSYRAIDVDYEEGDSGEPGHFAYDTVTHGFQLGVSFGF